MSYFLIVQRTVLKVVCVKMMLHWNVIGMSDSGSVNYQADQPFIPSRALRLLNDSPEQYSKINKYVKEWVS